GVQGLALLFSEQPEVVITDVQLPDMSGYELCQTVKRTPASSRVPVVLMSGRFTERQDRLQAFDLGADEYFAKPFDPRAFIARIQNVLRGGGDVAQEWRKTA